MDELKVREIIEGTLSAARFRHVSGVVEAAEQLAKLYSSARLFVNAFQLVVAGALIFAESDFHQFLLKNVKYC